MKIVFVLFQEIPGFFDCMVFFFPGMNKQKMHPGGISKPVNCFLHKRKRLAARDTPGCPEINNYHFSFIIRERDNVTLQVIQCKSGCWLPDHSFTKVIASL